MLGLIVALKVIEAPRSDGAPAGSVDHTMRLSAALRTRLRIASLTPTSPEKTRETEPMPTPARIATSFMPTKGWGVARVSLRNVGLSYSVLLLPMWVLIGILETFPRIMGNR